jgi:Aerotolerance regulator N-terminal
LVPEMSFIAALPFVTPWLFGAGAAAVSIPIIIHLLTRRRFRIQPWAAMEFLLAAHRRNIRRLRIQQLILLLLRCVAILLLAAGVAQFTPQGRALAALLGSDQTLSVVVWDDAYTMGYQPPGNNSVFSNSRDLLTGWLAALSGAQRVAILRGSAYQAPLMDSPTADISLALNAVRAQNVTDAGADLAGGLERALKIVLAEKDQSSFRQVWLVTDCARAACGADQEGNIADRIRKAAEQISVAGAELRVIDVGSPDAANMAITALETLRTVTVVNQPIRVKCTIVNDTPTAAAGVPVVFSLDGVPAGRQTIDRIDAGSSVTFTITLLRQATEPGMHVIEASLPPDSLPIDDVRRIVVQAVPSVPVLLVDGEPGDPERDILPSTAWLSAALAPEMGTSIFAPQTISELQLQDETLEHYRVVVLSDTGAPDAAMTERLRQFVSGGGLLMIFPGPDTNPAQWTTALETQGLLPAILSPTVTGPNGTVSFSLKGEINSVTLPFIQAEQDGIHTGFTDVHISRYMLLQPPVESHAQIIAQFSNGAPAVVMRRVDQGNVVLWATTCDTRWTDFPAQPSFLPFMYELFFAALPDQQEKWNLQVGQAIAAGAGELSDPLWHGPDGITISMNRRISGDTVELVSDPLWQAGIYQNSSGQSAVVNVDPADADIRHVEVDQIAALLGISTADVLTNPRSLADLTVNQATSAGDAGQRMLMLALAALVLEALLARAFSHYSHGSEARAKQKGAQRPNLETLKT